MAFWISSDAILVTPALVSVCSSVWLKIEQLCCVIMVHFGLFNSLLASNNFCCLLITFAYSLDPDQASVLKLIYSLKLKIKCNDWLLADTCQQAANLCALF